MERIGITGGSGFIGTNVIEDLLANEPGTEIVNLDTAKPKIAEHHRYWTPCDLMNQAQVVAVLDRYQPTKLIHLAGRTDMDGQAIDDYAVNYVSTKNVINAAHRTPTLRRIVFTSSQFVVGPGSLPQHDCDFRPHTIYGRSKVLAEQLIRQSTLTSTWTIIRPTNIWGRWHPRYPQEFWRILKLGRYYHPGGQSVVRSYGYVKTVSQQIRSILNANSDVVHKQVFYVGDAPIDIAMWTNAFSLALRGAPVRVVPRALLRSVSILGDFIVMTGGRFPLFTSRYRSMTEDYRTPMDRTFEKFGRPTIPLAAAVEETVTWLRQQDQFWR